MKAPKNIYALIVLFALLFFSQGVMAQSAPTAAAAPNVSQKEIAGEVKPVVLKIQVITSGTIDKTYCESKYRRSLRRKMPHYFIPWSLTKKSIARC